MKCIPDGKEHLLCNQQPLKKLRVFDKTHEKVHGFSLKSLFFTGHVNLVLPLNQARSAFKPVVERSHLPLNKNVFRC